MIGKWNVDVREDQHSSKLTMKAMRILAGRAQEKGSFFLPQGTVNPPPELHHQVFLFLDKAMGTITADASKKPTTQAFFKLLLNLQCFVLQDAAVSIHNGRENSLFSLPVFKTQLFQTYQASVIAKLMVGAGLDGAPTSIQHSTDVALPGFGDRLHNILWKSVMFHMMLHG